MKVLHVCAGNLFGGIETMLVTMARHRHECPELEQEFGTCFPGRLVDQLRESGAAVHDLGAVRLSRPLSLWRARRALRDVCERSAPDVVVCHGPWSMAVFGRAATRAGATLALWAHDRHDGANIIEYHAQGAQPVLTISNSRYTDSYIQRWLPRTARRVIHCPVEVGAARPSSSERAAVRDELGTPAEACVILHVGRMEPWKGQRQLIQALAPMRDDVSWHCWIVGGPQRPHETEYLNALVELASQLGISDRVQFCGQRGDVTRLLGAADIYCQPNEGPEPFGISLVEALDRRLPVITSAQGGALEIVDDSCGILVTPGDVNGVTAGLRSLQGDAERRARLGAAGAARVALVCDPAGRLRELHGAFQSVRPHTSRTSATLRASIQGAGT